MWLGQSSSAASYLGYTYIYIEREREGERELDIDREREREKERERERYTHNNVSHSHNADRSSRLPDARPLPIAIMIVMLVKWTVLVGYTTLYYIISFLFLLLFFDPEGLSYKFLVFAPEVDR